MMVLLLMQLVSFPSSLTVQAAENEQQGEKRIIDIEEEMTSVPLYEEADDSSNILLSLLHNDEVTLIEEHEAFSFVAYIDEEEQTWLGFINNHYLRLAEDDEEVNDELDEIAVEVNEIETDKLPEMGTEEFIKNDTTLANTEKTYFGIALKEKTNVYENPSKDAKVLRSYTAGAKLKYREFNANWYVATVIINGKATTGYIHISDVENFVDTQESLQGIALKSPTYIYAKAATNAKKLRSYAVGSVLKYKTFSKNWYEATVILNGKRTTGYIHRSHVENINNKQENLQGIALKSPTHIYAKAATSAKKIRSYAVGSVLKYKTFSKDWYEATVILNGKRTTGYIHRSHVENVVREQDNLRGIALKSPTHVYAKATTSAKKIRSYAVGSVLKYKTLSKNWYEATVILNGKRTTGYIHRSHVENAISEQEDLQGVAIKKPTRVYARASTGANTLRQYTYSTILKYKTFSSKWYEATIYLNGKPTTGYISKADVESMDYRFQGFAHKNPTNVYSSPSKNADVLRTYDRGSSLIYRAYDKDWFSATVKINESWETGYLHVDDVSFEMRDLIYKTKYNYDYKEMVDRQARKKPNADGAGKIEATRGQIEFYTNPLNFPKSSDEYFQFLVLSAPAGLTAKQINTSILNDNAGVLKGQAKAFIDAGKELKINEIYLISHALHETGNGKSTLASGIPVDKDGKVTRDAKGNIVKNAKTVATVYNMFGNGAYTSCPIDCGAKYAYDNKWFSIKAAIVGGINDISKYIDRGQNTLYKMRWNPIGGTPNPPFPEWHQYATHIQWATITTKRIAEMYRLLEDYTLEMDVPTFNNLPDYKKGAPATTTANPLKFRSGPGTTYGEIGTIPKGSEVLIVGSNVNAWYKVKYDGKTGWVSAQYVNLKY